VHAPGKRLLAVPTCGRVVAAHPSGNNGADSVVDAIWPCRADEREVVVRNMMDDRFTEALP